MSLKIKRMLIYHFGYSFLSVLTVRSLWAQSETTLWRLKFFVREVLERQANAVCGKDEHAKRKREIVSALSRTQSKRLKKQP
jgi:hypothetical protein